MILSWIWQQVQCMLLLQREWHICSNLQQKPNNNQPNLLDWFWYLWSWTNTVCSPSFVVEILQFLQSCTQYSHVLMVSYIPPRVLLHELLQPRSVNASVVHHSLRNWSWPGGQLLQRAPLLKCPIWLYHYDLLIYVYIYIIYTSRNLICHVSSLVNLFQVSEVWKAPDFHLVLADLPTASTPHNSASVPTTNLNTPASQVSRSNSCFFCHLHIFKCVKLHSNRCRFQIPTWNSKSILPGIEG